MSVHYTDRYSRSQREEKAPEGKHKGRHLKASVGGGRLCMHDVAVGNARDRDDMDAATRWRFA